jgi:peptidoglycan hydrolase CwlO-like protein
LKQIKTKLIAAVLVSAVFLVGLAAIATPAKADQFQDQIDALNAQISQNQGAVNQKRAQANTLANQIAIIQGQVNIAQQALNLTSLEIRQTQAEIDKANRDLDRQKEILKDNLRLVYKQGEVSPLELVASSKNLSDFVAQSQYLNAIKNKINSNLKKIDELKQELRKKQGDLNVLALQQQSKVNEVATQRAEQQRLLDQTKGEEAAYQKVVADNQKALQGIVAARAAAIRASNIQATSGGCGGYPAYLCNAPQDSILDPQFGLNRECVSWILWRRYQIGRPIVALGHAYAWYNPSTTNVSNAQQGDVIAWRQFANATVGYYGHVAIVEANDGQNLTISEFNFDFGQGPGKYGTRKIPYGSYMLTGSSYMR